MPSVFKKRIVRWSLNGQRCPAGTPGAVKTTEKTKGYYGWLDGKAVKLGDDGIDKRTAERLLTNRLNAGSLKAAGLSDPYADDAARPLAEHLADYRSHLEAKGNRNPRHVAQVIDRIAALSTACQFQSIADIIETAVAKWVASKQKRPTADAGSLVPPGDLFKPGDVAKLLGICPQAVRGLVARHALPVDGNPSSPRRLLPRATVERLVTLRADKSLAPQTINHYLRAVKRFARWLARSKRLPSNPLDTLSPLDRAAVRTDTRRRRRELSAADLSRLIVATRNSPRRLRGLTGEARSMLYLTAVSTGFRASALSNLTPADFHLTAETPLIVLPARFNKSRVTKRQPVPPEAAAALGRWLSGKPADQLVWPGPWASRRVAAAVLRFDLRAVGIPYAVPGPDGPLYADFHALRHSYLTLLARSGVELGSLQLLAGHSDPKLTAGYIHRSDADLAREADRLPRLVS